MAQHNEMENLLFPQSPPGEVELAVEAALDAGYKHIDTAYNYQNEEAVGNGLHKWFQKTGRKRSEVFIVTKVSQSVS